MVNAQETHPTQEQLVAFSAGKLGLAESTEIETHLADCDSCCEVLKSLPADTIEALFQETESDTAVAKAAAEKRPGEATQLPASEQPTILPRESGTRASNVLASMGAGDLPQELVDHPRYRVIELLGAGGMGDVYLAEHRVMNRLVALKVIRHAFVERTGAVERFAREIEAAAKLTHPNIVTAHDAEQAGNLHLLVMEYVDGIDLDQLLKQRGPLPVDEACDYIRQAAIGLQCAHESGMVHRDIKPHNLMVTGGRGQGSGARGQEAGRQADAVDSSATPVVKILDFGLANFVSESATSSGLTEVGSIMGTPDYMAPEQARDASSADIRADIYSLGCTLYSLLTGQAPYPEGTVIEKVMAHTEKEPQALSEFRDDVPPELVEVLAKMMAKDLNERYQTPEEVTEALSAFLTNNAAVQTTKPSPRVAPRGPRMVKTLIALSAAITILFGAAIIIATDRGRIEIQSEVDDIQIVVSQNGQQVTTIDLKTGSQVSWLPTGDYKIQLKSKSNDVKLSKTGFQMTRLGKVIVTATWNATVIELRGRTPARETQGDADTPSNVKSLQLVRTLEGHRHNIEAIDITPDGRLALSGGHDTTMRLWNLDTGKTLHVFNVGYSVRCLDISPDGRLVAVGGGGKHLRIWNLKTHEEYRDLQGHTGNMAGLSFSPDNRFLLATSNDGTTRYWDVEQGKVIHAFPLGVEFKYNCGTKISSDGRLGVVCPERQNPPTVSIFDLQSGKLARRFQLESGPMASGGIALNDDASTLLVAHWGRAVSVCDLASGTTRQMLSNREVTNVAFLPDNRHFVCDGWTVSVWDTVTGRRVAVSSKQKYPVRALAVTPDGKTILSGNMWTSRLPPINNQTRKEDFAIRVWRLPETLLPKSSSPRLYTISHKGELVRIDVVGKGFQSRVVKSLGAEFKAVEGLTMADGLLYAAANSTDDASRLYAINVETGEVSARGSLGVRQVDGLVWSDGGLFGVTSILGGGEAARLISIDPQSGKTRPIGKPLKLRDLDSLTFDNRGRLLTTDGIGIVDMFYELDRRGVSPPKSLAPTPAITADHDIEGLATGTDGMLYGVTHPETTAGKVSYLVRINPETFQHENLGGLGFGATSITADRRRLPKRVWLKDKKNKNSLTEVRRFKGAHSRPVVCLAVSPDGRRSLSGSYDATLRLWDIAGGREIRPFLGHTDRVNSVAFSPDGKRALSGSNDGTMRLWDVETGRPLKQFDHGGWVRAVAFSPDGRFALSGSADYQDKTNRAVRLWDIETGKQIRQFEGITHAVAHLQFLSDGRQVLVAGEYHLVGLWDVETGKMLKQFRSPVTNVVSAALSPDETRVVSGFGAQRVTDGLFIDPERGVVSLWDVETGREIRRFRGHTATVHGVGFSPDGRLLVTCSGGGHKDDDYFPAGDNTIRVWDVETGKELGRVDVGRTVNSVTFTPDGKFVISGGGEVKGGGGDGKPDLRLWRLPEDVRSGIVGAAGVKLSDKEQAAVKAAEAWLKHLDDGKYAESRNAGAEILRSSVTTQEWTKALNSLRKPSGKLVYRRLKQAKHTTMLPGMPKGEFVVVQFKTDFANEQGVDETLTMILERNNNWQVATYEVIVLPGAEPAATPPPVYSSGAK